MRSFEIVRQLRRLVALLGTAAVAELSGCATAGFAPVDLQGVVFAGNGAPLTAATIAVAGHRPVASDVTGRFVVPRVRPGTIAVTVERAGYESVSADLLFSHETDLLHLRLYSATDLANRAVAALTENAAESAVEYASRGLRIAPDSARLRFLLALARYRTGDVAQALETLSWFSGSDPPEAVSRLREAMGETEDVEQ